MPGFCFLLSRLGNCFSLTSGFSHDNVVSKKVSFLFDRAEKFYYEVFLKVNDFH